MKLRKVIAEKIIEIIILIRTIKFILSSLPVHCTILKEHFNCDGCCMTFLNFMQFILICFIISLYYRVFQNNGITIEETFITCMYYINFIFVINKH